MSSKLQKLLCDEGKNYRERNTHTHKHAKTLTNPYKHWDTNKTNKEEKPS